MVGVDLANSRLRCATADIHFWPVTRTDHRLPASTVAPIWGRKAGLNADLPRAGTGILAFHGGNGASDTPGRALRFAQNGAIVGLEIIVRPFNAMQAVGAPMGEAPGCCTVSVSCLLRGWHSRGARHSTGR